MPVEQAPVSRRISRADIPRYTNRYVRVGEAIRYPRTFPEPYWDDTLTWNDLSNWDE